MSRTPSTPHWPKLLTKMSDIQRDRSEVKYTENWPHFKPGTQELAKYSRRGSVARRVRFLASPYADPRTISSGRIVTERAALSASVSIISQSMSKAASMTTPKPVIDGGQAGRSVARYHFCASTDNRHVFGNPHAKFAQGTNQ